MPSAPQRRKRRAAASADDEAEAGAGAAQAKAKKPAPPPPVEEASSGESGEDVDSEETDDASDDSDEEGDAEAELETLWFSLEGCDPTPEDAPGIARLLRSCQLPPAVAESASGLAARLTDPSDGSRRFTSVVKQPLPADDAEAEADETVYSVVGLADLGAAENRRLRDFLTGGSPAARAALAADSSAVWLLVKARAPQLPAELALAQLEALQEELRHQVGSRAGTGVRRPRLLVVLSPAWRLGDGDGDSGGDSTAPMYGEDEILQGMAGGPWELLPAAPAAGSATSSAAGEDAARRCHRVCVLEAGKLGEAVQKLREAVGDRLRTA